MNIKITYNWLLEYLETDANPYEIQKYLSLCGPSVEKVEKIDGDYVFDIEITSNRVDTASVFGIAQEAYAILPQFGKKAKLKFNPLDEFKFTKLNDKVTGYNLSLHINITDPNLCSRFTAIVLANVQIKDSPEIIKKRLLSCGIKSINNVIDISNYLMIALGQPTHIFDYDSIGKQTMIMRQSKKGEKITTLDEKEIILPGGDIVIEDGDGKLIDLCGIMGGLNSSVKKTTKNIVLFIQTYNKQMIRKTSMLTSQRTVAAAYFEKGLDEERVEPALVYGAKLLSEYANGTIASKLYDIYLNPYKVKQINIALDYINNLIGVNIKKEEVSSILARLGFKINNNESFHITVPSYRKNDVEIKPDIVEEVARIHGYHNLTNNIQPSTYIKQPKDLELFFIVQNKTKRILKDIGLYEVMNYSMISEELIDNLNLNKEEHLAIDNAISEEIKYLRRSLLPSLIKNMRDNEGKKDTLKLFEIAKVYLPKENNLPDEEYHLGLASNTDFFDLKGIIEGLLRDLNIKNYQVEKGNHPLLSPAIQASISINNQEIGYFGQLKKEYQIKNEIKGNIYLAQIKFSPLVSSYHLISEYTPPNPYSVIKLDLTIEKSADITFDKIKTIAFSASDLLKNVEVINAYKNNLTLRLYFSSGKRNITEEEAKRQLEKIKQKIKSVLALE